MLLKGSKIDICQIPQIDFGDLSFRDAENQDCEVMSYDNVASDQFDNYTKNMVDFGFEKKESHNLGKNTFCSFFDGEATIILSYFPAIMQMRIVAQKGSIPLTFCDNAKEKITSSKLTLVDGLFDFGESLVLRLADGRFIVFDGGWEYESDAKKLMAVLTEQSVFDKPRIAAWIFTHPHIDHYRCFFVFYPMYKDDVIIENIIYNFPEATDELAEKLSAGSAPMCADEIDCMRRFETVIAECPATKIRAFTGQIFNISNARFELLSATDIVSKFPCDSNIFSLVFKATVDGQTIIFGADGIFDDTLLAERYGEYLKADILQVPHHGFNPDDSKAYKLINPDTCLVEVAETTFYNYMCIYYKGNQTLLYDLDVKDFFTGSTGNVVLDLPYKPRANGKAIYFDKIRERQQQIGAKSWFFTNMTLDNCKFTFVNAANEPTMVYAQLLFEDSRDSVARIRIHMDNKYAKTIDFNNPDTLGDEAFTMAYGLGKKSLCAEDIPKDRRFTVRFSSATPVVISGEKPAAYSN